MVDELRNAQAEDYQTALLAFVNCLVISAPVLKDRVRIRNEFIGESMLCAVAGDDAYVLLLLEVKRGSIYLEQRFGE